MIVAYVGLPGSGKTYSMAQSMLAEHARGRHIFANFPLKGARGFTDLKQVLGVRKGIIGADELNVLCPSRLWRNIPTEYMMLWTQSRKLGIDFWYTTQSFHRVDVSIRSITNFVWYHKRVFGRWHRAYLYDGTDFERGRTRKPLRVKNIWLKKSVWEKYDTGAIINPAEHVRGLSDSCIQDPMDLPIFEELSIDQQSYVKNSVQEQGTTVLANQEDADDV